jgi:hypothetical protein
MSNYESNELFFVSQEKICKTFVVREPGGSQGNRKECGSAEAWQFPLRVEHYE